MDFSPIDRDKAQTWPLKAKYRNSFRLLKRLGIDPPEGTKVYTRGITRAKSGGNSGSSLKNVRTIGPRRRTYGPW